MSTFTSLARRLCAAAASAGMLMLAAQPAQAQAQVKYQSNYQITLDLQMPEVTNLMLMEKRSDGGSSLTWAFTALCCGNLTDLTNPFPFDAPTTSSLLVGLAHDLPHDAPGQEHIVLFMNDQAASNINHIAWGTVFTTLREEELIQSLHDATSGRPFGDPVLENGLNAMWSFAGLADTEAKVGPNGLPGSMWFNTVGTFTVMAFSDGQVLGTGVSSLIEVPVAAVPEPGAYALWLAGLGIVGLLVRRRNLG